MAISNGNQQLALVVSSNSNASYEGLLESQKELISKQIYDLQNIVSRQCKLTGVNPLSQEMAAGALSVKIGKRPRDLLNPKAIKYMQSIFSVKDEINKKEIRAISALFGLTATQVRDFLNSQRSRVRRFILLSREKPIQSSEGVQEQDGSLGSNVDPPNHPVPLNSMDPSGFEAPSCSMQDEVLPDTDDSEKYFIANIFNLLRKEETLSGKMKLMEWILEIQNASVLYLVFVEWRCDDFSFVAESSSNRRANYCSSRHSSDISNRAKSLLSRWSKMFARSQAMRRPNANISSVDAQNEMLLKQSIGEIMESESLESGIDNPAVIYSLQENSEHSRSKSIKLLTGPSDDSNMKLIRGISSSNTRERRKVQLVEQPGQKPASRGPQVTRIISSNQGRPLSADDIQKAKMRAQFMRSKYGESYSSPQMKTEVPRPAKAHVHPKAEEHLAVKPHGPPKLEELKLQVKLSSGDDLQAVPVHGKEVMDMEEPVWNKHKRLQISWMIPPEMMIFKEWSVCSGENSKEIDVQNNRIRREKEVFYNTVHEIPKNHGAEKWTMMIH
ncbi:hypothetical protein L1987_76455 [Smallanthus sonchifolius]|uniref:Uncharacterized protein n=1 Tax=Smallanthus sonchifolius TaxID=185202 RepID=A0ACB8Z7Q4_9ASTR|nr:hypothetical protein L1987_76455 [Smallanthus sonchifolius]